jgi:beta-lactamase regulating signal transducer with metallopeptidase domain
METLMLYLVKANLVFTILFGAYLLWLKNENTFNANRAFLLLSLALAVILPFAPALQNIGNNNFPNYIANVNPLKGILATVGSRSDVVSAWQTANDGAVHNFWANITFVQVFVWLYVLVVLILLNKFIYQLLNLHYLYKTSKSYKAGNVIYCEHTKDLSPFSFFNLLFINPIGNYNQVGDIVEHEKVHIRQWHSADVLFAELAAMLLWINPLSIYLKRYLKLNLEYIADEGVLRTGVDKKQYQLSILHNSAGFKAYPLTNLFSSSKLKHRIKMINQKRKPSGWYKYLFVLPLVLVSYLLINPSAANSAGIKTFTSADTPLSAFEGIYQNQDSPTAYFEMKVVNNTLVAKRLDFTQQFTLKRITDLTFQIPGMEKNQTLPVVFTKNDAGQITQASVAGKHPWIKVKEYKPVVVVTLTPEQLKAVEGKYQFESNKNAFLTITAGASSLTMTTLWDGKKKENLVPLSDHEFLNIGEAFDLKFLKDDSGKVVKMIAYTSDVWDKVN